MDNTANDESIMAIIQPLLKAILKEVPSVQIIAPVTSKLLDPITRKQGNIPASSETRIIRGYVQKGALTKDSFHVLLHLQTPQPLDIFGNNKLHKVLSKYPVLSVSQAPFGISPVVMVGVIYGTMAAENRIELAKHLTQKILIHTKNKEIPIQVSWSKIHGSSEISPSEFATAICSKKEDCAEACLYSTDKTSNIARSLRTRTGQDLFCDSFPWQCSRVQQMRMISLSNDVNLHLKRT